RLCWLPEGLGGFSCERLHSSYVRKTFFFKNSVAVYPSSTRATGLTHPALAPLIFTGKQQTLNSLDLPIAAKLAIFSMWQYPVSMPAKWASQITWGSFFS